MPVEKWTDVQEDKIDPVRSKFGDIEKEEVSLEEKMSFVEVYIQKHRRFSFRNLLEQEAKIVLETPVGREAIRRT